ISCSNLLDSVAASDLATTSSNYIDGRTSSSSSFMLQVAPIPYLLEYSNGLGVAFNLVCILGFFLLIEISSSLAIFR
ncbi:hypothetical protein, partial [Pseudoalteromonas marina]